MFGCLLVGIANLGNWCQGRGTRESRMTVDQGA